MLIWGCYWPIIYLANVANICTYKAGSTLTWGGQTCLELEPTVMTHVAIWTKTLKEVFPVCASPSIQTGSSATFVQVNLTLGPLHWIMYYSYNFMRALVLTVNSGRQIQEKPLTISTQVPWLMQGWGRHSSTSVPQSSPKNPGAHIQLWPSSKSWEPLEYEL